MTDGSRKFEETPALPPAAAQSLDGGLAGLALVAGYYRIAADPAQLRHQLALTGRLAHGEDIVRGANILQLKSRILREVTRQASRRHPLSGDPGAEGGRLRCARRRLVNGRHGWSIRSPASRKTFPIEEPSGALLGRGGADHAPSRRRRRRSQHVWLSLVSAVDFALSAGRSPRSWSLRCSCSCSRWRRRSSSSSSSTRCWSTRACRR